MQRQDALLNRALRDQFEHPHALRLADAVGPVGGLGLHSRVPPGVVVDHGVCLGQVQADAASFQADQEQRHRAAGELLDQRIALLALSGQLDPGNLVFFELGLNQGEHAGEL